MADVAIRVAAPKDASVLVQLCRQLGHAVLAGDVQAELELPAENHHTLLVAILEGTVVGFLEVAARASVSSGRWAEITGLVVEEGARGQGVGGALVRAARTWAVERGLRRLRVRTRKDRAEAARLYEREGFRLSKEQRVYDVELS
jgi:GNAT superfamily N-acetyltransferase